MSMFGIGGCEEVWSCIFWLLDMQM